MLTKKSLARRTFLRGAGAAIALPFLESMLPAMAAPNRLTDAAPRRMAFVYVPNGVIEDDWRPKTEGRNWEITPTLASLERHRDNLLVFSGLAQHNGYALGDGPGDHARAASTFLTGVHPKKTNGADIHVGISVDQVAARAIGDKTRFASLELGTEPGRLAGNCDSGYSCAYSNSVSWRTATMPNPPEIDPRLVFERLFGDLDPTESAADRVRRRGYERSILDFVQQDTKRLQGDLGPTDRRKLEQYLDGIRQIERRIVAAEKQGERELPTMEAPSGVPVEFTDHMKVMFDLMAMAFQTDSTRIATFMIGREGSNRTYREIDVPEAHHGLSHHKGDEEKVRMLAKINKFHVDHFAYFLDKMKEVQDGEGSLLDNSMILYGSGLGDGNRHTHHDLPVLLAGSGGGTIHTGRHVIHPENTPLNNLFLSVLDRAGVATETLGDSTGKLEHLADL